MHILMIIFAVLTSVGVWYWRVQRAKDALDMVGDAAGHIRGAYNRNKFKKQTQGSVLADIDDPQTAAAVLMSCVVAEKIPLTSSVKQMMATELVEHAGMMTKKAEEAVEFGEWVSSEVSDTNTVIRKFLPIFRHSLEYEQRKDLVGMLQRISAEGGAPSSLQLSLIKQLRQGLVEH